MTETSSHPIVVDLGKVQHSEIERLRNGGGQIADDVKEIMRLLGLQNLPDAKRVFVPVVTVYRKAKKKRAKAAQSS